MPDPSDSNPREADRLIYAGLLGLSAASVLGMVEKGAPELPHQVAIHSFAVAIPLLVVGIITDYSRRTGTTIPLWHDLLCLFGAVASVVGLGSLFFSFGLVAGIVFICACAVGFIVVRRL